MILYKLFGFNRKLKPIETFIKEKFSYNKIWQEKGPLKVKWRLE